MPRLTELYRIAAGKQTGGGFLDFAKPDIHRCRAPPVEEEKTTPEPIAPAAVDDRRNCLKLFFATMVVCLLWAGYTDHAWEDWYITFRASKNLATGNGLTFTAGEAPVHSFTSPLGTTVPALCSFLAGPDNDKLALWFYRIFGSAMLGGGVVLLYGVCRRHKFADWALIAFVGSVLLESKTIDHTINGMETGLMLCFMALAIRAHVMPGSRRWLMLGLAWGGLMWSRPDGFVYGGAIAFGFLAFPAAAGSQNRREIVMEYLKAIGVAALIYLPWTLITWNYYGSPIPNTILAKRIDSAQELGFFHLIWDFFTFPFSGILSTAAFEEVLTPSYARSFEGWPDAVYGASRLLTFVACFYWLVPFAARFGRSISFAAMMACFYLTDVTPHSMPWYLPNAGILVLLTLGAVFNDGLRLADHLAEEYPEQSRSWRRGVEIAVMVQLSFLMLTFFATAWQSRLQQQLVEDGVRTKAGLWLKENASSPNDTVLVECLGYIGFFSGLKMYDYPGMGTPETVAARSKLRETHGPYGSWAQITPEQKVALIREMKPDWLALRPPVAHQIHEADSDVFNREYLQVETFSNLEKILEIESLPGRNFLTYDATFFIFKRRDPTR